MKRNKLVKLKDLPLFLLLIGSFYGIGVYVYNQMLLQDFVRDCYIVRKLFISLGHLFVFIPVCLVILGSMYHWKRMKYMSMELMDKNQLLDLLEKDFQHVYIVVDLYKYKIKYAPSNIGNFIEEKDFNQIKQDLKASSILLNYFEEEAYRDLQQGFEKAKKGERHSVYIRAKNKIEDENRWFHVSFYALEKQDIIISFQDVTQVYQQQIQLKEALEKTQIAEQAKTQFLANISHEMRTPMNAIIGLTEIGIQNATKRGCGECEQRLKNAEKVSEHLLELINNLLDIEKVSSGKATLNEEVIYLPDLVDDITQIMGQRIKDKQQELIVEIDESMDRDVIGDELRLKQIIINLLSNANKFTPDRGKITWKMEAEVREEDSIQLKIVVQDTGIGIREEDQKKIFNAFEQVGHRYIGAYEGTGLGLPLTKDIVQLMGGSIEVQSELGAGSQFTVYVHLKKAQEGHSIKSKSLKNNMDETLSHTEVQKEKCILLVDDVAINRMIVEELLSEHPYRIETAADGLECLEKFTASSEGYYDMILMDIQMPLMNGYEATEAIRKSKRQDADKVVIIAMSANVYKEDIEQAEKAGMDDYIGKPISLERLLATLKKY